MKGRFDVIACYDVETISEDGKRRLRRMSKACSAFGQRVQYSVFELNVTAASLEQFLQRARNIMNVEFDSLRIYFLSGDREDYLKVYGRDGWVDFEAPLIL